MPKKSTVRRARQLKREGKAPTTQAGEFVREEMHHMKEGRHSSGNPKQAIAIGLSKARQSGVKVGPKKKATAKKAAAKKKTTAKRKTASKKKGRA
jgi:hypothetical protein